MSKAILPKGPEADAHWRSHVEAQRKSGLSKKQYCRNHQLKDFALDYWVKKFNKAAKKPKSSFAKVEVSPTLSTKANSEAPSHKGRHGMRLVLPNGLALEIGPDCDVANVARLLAAMGGSR